MSARWYKRAAVAAVVITAVGIGYVVAVEEDTKVRPAYCAGRWYPGSRELLTRQVDDLLKRASPVRISGKPVAVISPHAGYQFSAAVAAAGYRCLQGHTYKRVIGLAFSHQHAKAYQGVAVQREFAAYRTPLGEVPIDREIVARLWQNKDLFVWHPEIDRGEHSLELQLPFLQRVLEDFRLVPLLVGCMSASDYAEAARAIVPWVDEDTLLVASSDFTHFGPNYGYQPFNQDVPTRLRELGDNAAAPLLKCDFDGFVDHLARTGDSICGQGPIQLLLRILSMQGPAKGVRAAYDTSGNMIGDWNNSVTYQSFVFIRQPPALDERCRAELLRMARQTVAARLKGEKLPEVDAGSLPAALRADGACFVTLKNHGQLRGCIGNLEARGPLYRAVIDNAVLACQDSRFVYDPVTPKELDELNIEISHLTPMKRVRNTGEIIVGRHGLVIAWGGRSGVLLPQVASEYGWTREQFLARTCHKAGLPLDAWKRSDAQIYSFEAEVFREPEPAATQPAARR